MNALTKLLPAALMVVAFALPQSAAADGCEGANPPAPTDAPYAYHYANCWENVYVGKPTTAKVSVPVDFTIDPFVQRDWNCLPQAREGTDMVVNAKLLGEIERSIGVSVEVLEGSVSTTLGGSLSVGFTCHGLEQVQPCQAYNIVLDIGLSATKTSQKADQYARQECFYFLTNSVDLGPLGVWDVLAPDNLVGHRQGKWVKCPEQATLSEVTDVRVGPGCGTVPAKVDCRISGCEHCCEGDGEVDYGIGEECDGDGQAQCDDGYVCEQAVCVEEVDDEPADECSTALGCGDGMLCVMPADDPWVYGCSECEEWGCPTLGQQAPIVLGYASRSYDSAAGCQEALAAGIDAELATEVRQSLVADGEYYCDAGVAGVVAYDDGVMWPSCGSSESGPGSTLSVDAAGYAICN